MNSKSGFGQGGLLRKLQFWHVTKSRGTCRGQGKDGNDNDSGHIVVIKSKKGISDACVGAMLMLFSLVLESKALFLKRRRLGAGPATLD